MSVHPLVGLLEQNFPPRIFAFLEQAMQNFSSINRRAINCSTQPYLLVVQSVGRSIGWSETLRFSASMDSFSITSPCPNVLWVHFIAVPAHADLDSGVSGIVSSFSNGFFAYFHQRGYIMKPPHNSSEWKRLRHHLWRELMETFDDI